MIFLAKHWVFLLLALGALYWFKRKGATSIATVDPNVQKVAAEAAVNWPGGTGDISKIRLADQTLYPGYYVNEHGGYFNPETGDSYSPGSSPVVYRSAYDTGAAVRVDIGDAVAEMEAAAAGARPVEVFPDAIIY